MPKTRTSTRTATRASQRRALPTKDIQKGPRSTKRRAAPALPIPEKYLNPIPTVPDHSQRPLHLFIWGVKDPDVGQLGLGTTCDYGEVWKPRRHPWVDQSISNGTFGDEPESGLVSVSGGGMHTYILDERGTVWSCGSNDDNALGRDIAIIPPQEFGSIQTLIDEHFPVVQLAAGDSFGAALNPEGQLRVWGTFRQSDGSTRFSPTVTKQTYPTHVPIPHRSARVTSISAGDNHILALSTHGGVYAWGVGERGQLGRRVLARHTNDALVPQKVLLGNRSRKAVVIGTGMKSSFAVDEQGEVWAWGSNDRGQLGLGFSGDAISTPVRVQDLSPEVLGGGDGGGGERVVQIAGGEWHTLFLTSLGKIYACGACDDFQLGIPQTHEVFQEEDEGGGGGGFNNKHTIPTPILVSIPQSQTDPAISISAGLRCSMAITSGGALFTWGCGTSAQLGIGEDIETQEIPHMVVRREGGSWEAVKVSCGGQHSLGLFRKREVAA